MMATDMGTHLKQLHAPETREDVIQLLQQACDAMDTINAHLRGMLERAKSDSLAA